jgi:hypothetical protein
MAYVVVITKECYFAVHAADTGENADTTSHSLTSIAHSFSLSLFLSLSLSPSLSVSFSLYLSSCKFEFGVMPMALEEDPVSKTPCLSACPLNLRKAECLSCPVSVSASVSGTGSNS